MSDLMKLSGSTHYFCLMCGKPNASVLYCDACLGKLDEAAEDDLKREAALELFPSVD